MVLQSKHTIVDFVQAFSKGHQEGFNYFFRKLYPSLCFYAQKMTCEQMVSEDIVSGAFIKIWQKHSRFDCEEKISAYLYRIVRNDALKYLHQQKKKLAAHAELSFLFSREQQPDHFETIVKAETIRQLYELITTLAPQCARVLQMLYADEKTVKEIAEELGLSVSTVKTQKARGLVLIKERFRVMNS